MPSHQTLIAALDRLIEASRREVREARIVPIERRLERDMARAFRAQGRRFLTHFAALWDQLPGHLDDAQWGRYLDLAQLETRDLFDAAVRDAMSRAMTEGIRHAAEELPVTESLREADDEEIAQAWGISFDLKNPRAVRYLEDRGARLVSQVDATTRSYIKTVVTEGADKGWSYNQMAKAITDRYSEFAVGRPQQHIDSRAHLIAVTEVGEAYSHGNYLVGEHLRDLGLSMEKAWDTMKDGRVSEGCAENEAAGWIPLDDAFPSGDMRPLRFPGCRCDLLMRRVEGVEAEPERPIQDPAARPGRPVPEEEAEGADFLAQAQGAYEDALGRGAQEEAAAIEDLMRTMREDYEQQRDANASLWNILGITPDMATEADWRTVITELERQANETLQKYTKAGIKIAVGEERGAKDAGVANVGGRLVEIKKGKFSVRQAQRLEGQYWAEAKEELSQAMGGFLIDMGYTPHEIARANFEQRRRLFEEMGNKAILQTPSGRISKIDDVPIDARDRVVEQLGFDWAATCEVVADDPINVPTFDPYAKLQTADRIKGRFFGAEDDELDWEDAEMGDALAGFWG